MNWPAPNIDQPRPQQRTAYRIVSLALYLTPVAIMTWHVWQAGVIWMAGFIWTLNEVRTRR